MAKSKRWLGLKPIYLIITIILALLALGIVIYYFTSKNYPVQETIAYMPEDLTPAEDYIIVKFKDNVTNGQEQAIINQVGSQEEDLLANPDTKKIDVPEDNNAVDFAKEIQVQYKNEIKYAELDQKAGVMMTPNDPEYYRQWFLPKVNASEAWDVEMGNGDIVVAVLDTGVSNHADVSAKYLAGYNVVDGNNNPADGHGHGTFVSSITAAVTNNNLGIAGSAPNVKILPVKVLTDDGWGYYSWIASGILWAVDHGADVINMSLGGSSNSSVMQDAINYAYSKDVVVVASAGNSGTSSPSYPANSAHVISVGATDINDARASFSQYGSWLDMVAPGVNIFGARKGGGYGYWNGTSFSAPIVSALSGLVRAKNPEYTPAEIEAVILDNADDLGTSGKDNYFGWGRANFYKTLTGEAPQIGVGSISGKVYHRAIKTPISGAIINVYLGGAKVAMATTISDGTYIVENIERGTYQVREETKGYTTSYQDSIYVMAGQNTGRVNFAIYSKNPVIYGCVINRITRGRIPNAVVRLSDIEHGTIKKVFTNFRGCYIMTDITRRGWLNIYAHKRNYIIQKTKVYLNDYYSVLKYFYLKKG